MESPPFSLKDAHQYFAKSLNGEVWKLLAKKNRSTQEDHQMLLAAFSSCYHWLPIGDEVHQQRGTWLISRVYAALENPEQCYYYANLCWQLTQDNLTRIEVFDQAYACESLARAYALLEKRFKAKEFLQKAKQFGEKITDLQSRKLFEDDLAWGDWKGITLD